MSNKNKFPTEKNRQAKTRHVDTTMQSPNKGKFAKTTQRARLSDRERTGHGRGGGVARRRFVLFA